MERLNAKQTYEVLSNFVNNYSCDKDTFLSEFLKDHNTLQQSVIRLCFEIIEIHAMQNINYIDLRNKKSHEICNEIVNNFNEKYGYKLSESLPTI